MILKHHKFILMILFSLLVSLPVFAQDVSLPRDVAEKALKALELVPELENKIEKLEKNVDELERAKLTPCAVAMIQVKNDLVYWLSQIGADAAKNKQVEKILKDVRKTGRQTLKSQCNFSNQSDLMKVLDVGSRFLPLLLIFR